MLALELSVCPGKLNKYFVLDITPTVFSLLRGPGENPDLTYSSLK